MRLVLVILLLFCSSSYAGEYAISKMSEDSIRVVDVSSVRRSDGFVYYSSLSLMRKGASPFINEDQWLLLPVKIDCSKRLAYSFGALYVVKYHEKSLVAYANSKGVEVSSDPNSALSKEFRVLCNEESVELYVGDLFNLVDNK